VTAEQRGFQHGTDALVRRVDRRLATLRLAARPQEVALAERLAASLRDLIVATAGASAADRALVRAAVHRFALRRDLPYPGRSLIADLRMVNRTALDLGRADLVVAHDALQPAPPRSIDA
jgi:hypothetical protein